MTKFRCIPVAAGLPITFISVAIVNLGLTWYYWIDLHDISDVYAGIAISVFSCVLAGITAFPSFRRVELHDERIICKGLLPRDTFEMEYARCNVGIDYHCQHGSTIWWIYLCYGAHPCFKKGNNANRMNAVKIKPGFVKIMYSDAVYNALIDVLPKKQRIALETARRYANFERQGKII